MRLESTVPMHPQLRPFILQIFLDFCASFSPESALIFLVITIHHVIWPSPGTLGPAELGQIYLGNHADKKIKGFCGQSSQRSHGHRHTGSDVSNLSSSNLGVTLIPL